MDNEASMSTMVGEIQKKEKNDQTDAHTHIRWERTNVKLEREAIDVGYWDTHAHTEENI